MSEPIYKRRMIDEIMSYLDSKDVIVIHGARQVGKTSILRYILADLVARGEKTVFIDLEDSRFVNLLNQGVDELVNYLAGEGFLFVREQDTDQKLFVFIDEIQYLENPSSFLKLMVDHHQAIKLIVSGSSSFEMKSKFKDSLVGRTVNFEVFPLSFEEILSFKGIPFNPAEKMTSLKNQELRTTFTEYAIYGGYPRIVLTSELGHKERYLQQIVDTYIRKDIKDMAEIRDITRFNRMLEILSSQSGNLLNLSELSNTCGLARQTVERYLFLLEQTYILRLVRPYARNLRSELVKTPKIYFYDTGLMQILWLKRLQSELLGSVFETSLFSEWVKRFGGSRINYWRTTGQQEIDFIIQLPEETLAIEAKTTFPRTLPTSLENFSQGKEKGLLVALNGEPMGEHMIYPWQVGR